MPFVWALFLIHLAPLMHHYPCSYILFFPSFLFIHLSIRDKKGESIVIFIWLLCTFSGGEILSYAHSYGEKFHRGDAYTKGEKTSLYEKTLFYLFYIMFVFLFTLVLWVMFSIYTLLFSSHRVYCWTCIHPYAIVLYWLHVRMIICFAMWSL